MRVQAIVFAAAWAGFLAVWWCASRVARRSESERARGRLLGYAKKQGKAKQQRPARLIAAEDRETGKIVMSLLARFKISDSARLWLEQAGLTWSPARVLHACLALFLAVFSIVWFGIPAARGLAPAPALAVGALPLGYIARRRSKRLWKFESQFPECLEFIGRSMRAGHAFSVSLDMLHKEFSDPLAGEFRRTFDEHNLGLPLDAALLKLAHRVPIMEVQFFVSAVLLQRRTGGNLAELLDKLAYVIRERFKLRGKIRAVSAHGRMTGGALSTIPLIVAGMMFVVNREFITFFITDPTGRTMAGAAVALQLLGYGVIRKIVSIEA